MVKAQEYLDEHYSKKQRWIIEEIDLSNLDLEGDLDLTDFRSLKEINISSNPQLGKMINSPFLLNIKIKARDWLDWKYHNKKEIREIEIENECIYDELIIDDFPNLEEIEFWRGNFTKFQTSNCPKLKRIKCRNSKIDELIIFSCPNLRELDVPNTQLSSLDIISSCPNLKRLDCSYNLLTDLDLTNSLQLESLTIESNNFPEQDLSFISHLVNLEWLSLGNTYNEHKVNQGIYNRFYGSLEHLKNMTSLEYLYIENTDLNSGVEYLPVSIKKISYSAKERPKSKIKEIAWQLDLFNSKEKKSWEEMKFSLAEIKQWTEIGLKFDEHYLVDYLKKKKKLCPQEVKLDDLVSLRKEYKVLSWKDIHSNFTPELRQEWEKNGFNYQQTQEWINKGLKPYRDAGFAYYLEVGSHQTSELLTSDLIELSKKYRNPQTYIDFWYPSEERKEITELNLGNRELRGDLIIEGWENLKEINCFSSSSFDNFFSRMTLKNLPKLTSLDARKCKLNKLVIDNCSNLQKINLVGNCLTDLEFLDNLNPNKLVNLNIAHNKFTKQDLSFLRKFVNLEEFHVGFNEFYGSLEHLQNLRKLKEIDVSYTDIDHGLEYLPDNLEVIWCGRGKYTYSKIRKELEDYYLGERETGYNYRAWKEHQVFFQLLAENLKKIGSNIMNTQSVRKFLNEQGVFFNVRTNIFYGDLQGLISLLQFNQSFFEQKEIKIILLESQIQELINLIKEQEEKLEKKVAQAYLCFSSEKELLQELISIHSKYVETSKKKLPAVKLRRQRDKVRDELEEKLGEEFAEEIELTLNDYEELVIWKLELETKLRTKSLLLEERKQIPQITIINSTVHGNIVGYLQTESSDNDFSYNKQITYQTSSVVKESKAETNKQCNSKTKTEEELKAEKKILIHFNNFLGAKEIFLNVRRSTIERLQNCCDRLEGKNNSGKFARFNEVGDIVSAFGEVVSSLTFGIPKAVGNLITAVNNTSKRKFSTKSIEAFNEHLENDDAILSCFNEIYNSLTNTIRENKELEIVDDLKLRDEPESKEVNLFNTKHKIFDVIPKNIWRKKVHLSADEMKETIKSLSESLEKLKLGLEKEKEQFKKYKSRLEQKRQLRTCQEIPPKNS